MWNDLCQRPHWGRVFRKLLAVYNFSDQLIKGHTFHRFLEALISSTMYLWLYLLLLLEGEREKENIHPATEWNDFKPLKKRPKMNQEAMFPKSSISHCTFNIISNLSNGYLINISIVILLIIFFCILLTNSFWHITYNWFLFSSFFFLIQRTIRTIKWAISTSYLRCCDTIGFVQSHWL